MPEFNFFSSRADNQQGEKSPENVLLSENINSSWAAAEWEWEIFLLASISQSDMSAMCVMKCSRWVPALSLLFPSLGIAIFGSRTETRAEANLLRPTPQEALLMEYQMSRAAEIQSYRRTFSVIFRLFFGLLPGAFRENSLIEKEKAFTWPASQWRWPKTC